MLRRVFVMVAFFLKNNCGYAFVFLVLPSFIVAAILRNAMSLELCDFQTIKYKLLKCYSNTAMMNLPDFYNEIDKQIEYLGTEDLLALHGFLSGQNCYSDLRVSGIESDEKKLRAAVKMGIQKISLEDLGGSGVPTLDNMIKEFLEDSESKITRILPVESQDLKPELSSIAKNLKVTDSQLKQLWDDVEKGMKMADVARKYHISFNTAKRYNALRPKIAARPLMSDDDRMKSAILNKHTARQVETAKALDDDVTAAGLAVQQQLKELGLDIDLRKMEPNQIVKLSAGLGNMKSGKKEKMTFEDFREMMMIRAMEKIVTEDNHKETQKPAEYISIMTKMIEENARQREEFQKTILQMKDEMWQRKFEDLENAVNGQSPLSRMRNMAEERKQLGEYVAVMSSPMPEIVEVAKTNLKAQNPKISVLDTIIEKGAGVVESFIKSKNPPEMGSTVNAPSNGQGYQQGQQGQQGQPQPQMTWEEYEYYLVNLPNKTPEQNQWLKDYYQYLEQQNTRKEYQPQVSYAPPEQETQDFTVRERERQQQRDIRLEQEQQQPQKPMSFIERMRMAEYSQAGVPVNDLKPISQQVEGEPPAERQEVADE